MRCAYTATYQQQGEWYLAWVEEVPGVNTQGRTLTEAKRNLRDALRLIIQGTSEKVVISSGAKRSRETPIASL